MWNAGLGDLAYNKLRLEDGGGRRGRLQLRVDVGGRLHRRVLRGRRQRHQAGLPAAEHDRLLVVRAADADERRRHLRRGRRRRSDPVPEGLRAGARPDRREEVHRQPVLGHPGAVRAARRRASSARTSAVPARPATSRRRRRRPTTQQVGKWFKTIPPFGAAAPQASSTFTFGYYINTWGLIKGLKAVERRHLRRPEDAPGGDREGEARDRRTGRSTWTRTARRSSTSTTSSSITKDGKLAIKTVGEIPSVDQTFGGTFSDEDAGAGTHVPAVREAEPAVDRQDDRTRRSPANALVTDSSSSRARRADPPLAGDRPAVRRPPRRARRRPRRRARREARDPRPERRREDDALQRHLRRLPAELGHDRVPRRRTSRMLPPRARAKLGMGRTYQKSRSFLGLSVEDNLYLARARRAGGPPAPGRRCAAATASCASARASSRAPSGSTAREQTLVGSLSHGEQRQLEVGDGARRRTRR